MKDRISAHPGRVELTDVLTGEKRKYDMVMADDPKEKGDPPVKANLLKDATAALYGKDGTAVPDAILALLSKAALLKQTGGEPLYTRVNQKVSELSVGDKIRLPDGVNTFEYIVAQKNYEATLNGAGRTLLVRSQAYADSTIHWNDDRTNQYDGSTLDKRYQQMKNDFPESFISVAGMTKFPCTVGNGNANIETLERTFFALSLAEIGLSYSNTNTEGSKIGLDLSEILSSKPFYYTRTPITNTVETATAVYYYTPGEEWSIASQTVYSKTTSSGTPYLLPALTVPDDMEITVYQDAGGGYHSEQAYTNQNYSFTDVLGNLIPQVQFEFGSYIGNGHGGPDFPLSLTFNNPPKYILIPYSVSSAGSVNSIFLGEKWLIDLDIVSTEYESGRGLGETSGSYSFGKKSRDGKTYFWYRNGTDTSGTAEAQLNVANATYYYGALSIIQGG